MKKISLLLSFLFLLQSCSVYRSPTSLDEAVAADKKVKVVTADEKKYRFKRLERENDRLYGITGKGSVTAKRVVGLPATYNGDLLKVDLSQVAIEEVRLRNNILSAMLNIAIPIVALAAGLVASDPDFFLPD